MKSRLLKAGLAALLLAGVSSLAWAEAAESTPCEPARHWGGRGHHPGLRGWMHQRLLKEFDADKDGKLSDEERAAAREARQKRHQETLAKFDADKDGKLNDQERKAAREAAMLERLDTDGDGKISDEEKAAGREKMGERLKENRPEAFAKIDKDGDGKISDEEHAAARGARMAWRHRRPGPPRAPAPEKLAERLLKKFDADADGKLDQAELKKALAAMHRPRRGGFPHTKPASQPVPEPAEQ